MKDTKVKFPAPYLVHWVTGAVACCIDHANKLVGLGEFMGSVVPVSKNLDESLECKNCKNESKDS